MNKDLALKILEAILLSSRRKVKKSILQKFFSGFNLDELIKEASSRYQNFGFFIFDDGKNLELVTKKELASYLLNFFGFEEDSIANEFLEVLAIIAYCGPINLKEINKLRGESSSFIVKELLVNGLIKKEKNDYQITMEFLKILGFKRQEDLPDYQILRKELKREK